MSFIACLLLFSSVPLGTAGEVAASASIEKSSFLRREMSAHKVGVQHMFSNVGDAMAKANITREQLLQRLEARSKAFKAKVDSSASSEASSKDSPFAACVESCSIF